jgi:hypothetical protein
MNDDPTCLYCGEPVLSSDRSETVYALEDARPTLRMRHFECAARAIIGSVGHLQEKCSCYGGTEEDPPGMTPRQAAKAALDYFRVMSVPFNDQGRGI